MNSDEVTKPQFTKLAEQLRRKRDYFDSLIARMNALRFDTNDRYYRLVKKTRTNCGSTPTSWQTGSIGCDDGCGTRICRLRNQIA
jgi:hypothetical protein